MKAMATIMIIQPEPPPEELLLVLPMPPKIMNRDAYQARMTMVPSNTLYEFC